MAALTGASTAPGSTLTRGTEQLFYGPDGQFKHAVQQLLAHIPLGRPGKPEEIAHAIDTGGEKARIAQRRRQ